METRSRGFHKMFSSSHHPTEKTIRNRTSSRLPTLNKKNIGKEQILWFDISMNNTVPVQVIYGIQNLRYNIADKGLTALEMIHKGPILNVLHQQEDMVVIVEVGIELGDIGMIIGQQVMNLQFLAELFHHAILYNSRLEYLLQCKDKASALMLTDMDISKFARTYAFPQLKLPHGEWPIAQVELQLFLSLLFLVERLIYFKLHIKVIKIGTIPWFFDLEKRIFVDESRHILRLCCLQFYC